MVTFASAKSVETSVPFYLIWNAFVNRYPLHHHLTNQAESHGNPSRHRAHGEFSSRRIIVQAGKFDELWARIDLSIRSAAASRRI